MAVVYFRLVYNVAAYVIAISADEGVDKRRDLARRRTRACLNLIASIIYETDEREMRLASYRKCVAICAVQVRRSGNCQLCGSRYRHASCTPPPHGTDD